MNKKPLCYISHASVDTNFIYETIIPILEKLEVDIWIANERLKPGRMISEMLINGIKKSDFVICLTNRRSTYVHYEIGIAIGNNKPIIGIVNEFEGVYPFGDQINFILSNHKNFREILRRSINDVLENVINKSAFNIYKGLKIIGLQAGISSSNLEEELNFTSDFLVFLKSLNSEPNFKLLETSKGSLKSLISLDLKSWAELLEKVIFCIPELKRKKSERLKIDSETEKIQAETRTIDNDRNIKQAEAFVGLLEKYQKLGIKIQIDDDLLITQNSQGQLEIKKPNEPENTTGNTV